MELDEREVRAGWTWFIAAGVIATAFCVFLYKADNGLTFSDREKRLGATLRELRTAQFTVAGNPSDLREMAPDLRREGSSYSGTTDHSSH